MNTIKYNICRILGFKYLLRVYFDSLMHDYDFVETTEKNLTIPEWLRWGIAYTNNDIVIIFSDDIRENRFETIIYKIQPDFKIPIYTKDYFTLENFLIKKNETLEATQIAQYNSKVGVKNSIEKTLHYLTEYINEIVTIP